ncbi:tyrosine-type recombinase/integrase [Achromobacter animicus]|uniref:tyrosine-type recombinase/integrase n=1 Tax=Achromobacter animicus TaxID=1389935 RepID=UPI0028A720B6|nr:tyrosine-type recombinase/integrase [Achromobacter animicus]
MTGVSQGCAGRLRYAGRDQEAALLERASTHWLRHTFGRQLTTMGVDVRVIAKAMRHEDIRTSMAYTELDFLDVVRELERTLVPDRYCERRVGGQGACKATIGILLSNAEPNFGCHYEFYMC